MNKLSASLDRTSQPATGKLVLGLLVCLPILMVFGSACENGNQQFSNTNNERTPVPLDSKVLLKKEKDRREGEEAGLDEMDRFAARYSVGSLREKRLPANTYELRIWIGVSPDTTRGLILTENSALYLPPIGDIGQGRFEPARALAPETGWEAFWNDVGNSGLIYFPEEPEAEEVEPWNDSNVVIVEVRKGNNYRSVMYGFPCHSKRRQAKLLINAIIRVSQRLGIEFYSCA